MITKNKHHLIFSKAFNRVARKLEGKYKEILEKRLKEIANEPLTVGKELKGPFKEIRAARLNRRYRIFYKIPRECHVQLINIYHREIAYK